MLRARPMLLLVVAQCLIGATDARAQANDADTAGDAGGEHPTVQRVDWTGNAALSRSILREHILTQATRWPRFWQRFPFYEDETREDMHRISALYRQHGYFEARAEYELSFSEDGSRVAIAIRVQEGEPVRIDSLRVRLSNGHDPGTHPLIDARDWKKLVARLDLTRGKIFRLDDYRTAREMILNWVAERGFPQAQLEGGANVDLKQHRTEIDWTLSLRSRVRFGEIEIEGLENVEERIIRREIRLEPGEWYSTRAMARTRRRIQNLDLFRWTVVDAEAPDHDVVAPDRASESPGEVVWPVSIRLAERPPRRIRAGGGWGTDTSFRAELSWHHRNFFGGARRMDVGIRYSGLGATFRPSFVDPYFLGTRTRLLISPALVYEKQDAYTARRIVVDVQLQRKLFKKWMIRVGYRFDRDDIYSVVDEPGDDELPEGLSITTGPELGLRRSTVDDPLNAHSGTWIDLGAQSSITALGSEQDFVRYTLEARRFFEIYQTVLASRMLIGTIQNHGDTNAADIPLVERFYSGGANSMRGFGYRSLSPKDANGDSIGGSSIVEASVEWRLPIWGNLGAVAFVDAAQVEADPWSFGLDDLRYAAGPGLRYGTPAGPLRLDFAWRLNPRDERGKFRISASLGHTF